MSVIQPTPAPSRKSRKVVNGLTRSLAPDKRPIKPLPKPDERARRSLLASPVELQRGFFLNAAKMLRSSSLAYRLDQQYQQMMRSDADIEGCLRSLLVTMSGLEWAVQPDDQDDPKQVDLACKVTAVLRDAPRLTDLFRCLHEAVWYGCSAVNLVYQRDEQLGVRITQWMPLHPDTLAFDEVGNLAMRVGSGYDRAGDSVEDIGWDSRVHIFDAVERKSVAFHRVFTQAPDFIDAASSERQYRGVGARDVAWFLWLMKQEALQNCASYVERYALGIRVGYYPSGNSEARDTMLQVLANLTNDNSVALPMVGSEKQFDLEVKEAATGRGQVFMELINWISGKIKESILGQNLSSESGGSGLGSGLAQIHADTLAKIVRYHADALAESMTTDVIRVVCAMLGAEEGTARHVRLVFAPERADTKAKMEAIEAFIRIGGRVSESSVREMLGLTPPEEGEAVLGGKSIDPDDPLSTILTDDGAGEGDAPSKPPEPDPQPAEDEEDEDDEDGEAPAAATGGGMLAAARGLIRRIRDRARR